jgi:FdrA protein
MAEVVELRPAAYFDSVSLMAASEAAAGADGVDVALVAMATPLNLDQLGRLGFERPPGAQPDALLVAVRAATEAALIDALAAVEHALAPPGAPTGAAAPVPARTAGAAGRRLGAELALLSVPGRHAFVEAMDALASGLSVMVFSSGMPVEDEVALKAEAAARGLLVMGPDCGTSILDGIGLGFANVVRPGPVGIAGASGTGTQQVCCLLDAAGVGISSAIGTGGRDLSAAVGGASTLAALELLAGDPATEVIVIVSKPPDPTVASRVADAAAGCGKPVVRAFVGGDGSDLTEAAATALRLLGVEPPEPRVWPAPHAPAPARRRLRGLFTGGTLCSEAAAVLRPRLRGRDHRLVDLGGEEFTDGRAHPMIDPRLRLDRIAAAAAEPGATVFLLDVVLGRGAHPDPAGEVAPVLRDALARDRGSAAAVSLCGTAGDPQGLERQAEALAAAGAEVHLSNAAAARAAAGLLEQA